MDKVISALPSVDQTWFECADHPREHPRIGLAENRTFSCPVCGGLQIVAHDLTGAGVSSWEGQSRLSPQRISGVWKYSGAHGIMMPRFPKEHIVTLGEGNEPILEAGHHLYRYMGRGFELHLQMQGMNPTGSFKARGMTLAVSVAKALGIKAIICASTGDTSAAAAAYAARAGISCFVIIPGETGEVTIVQWHQPDAYGATTLRIPGGFDVAMRSIQQFADEGLIFVVNSRNPLRIEGHMSATFDIARHFDWVLPHVVVVPLGNGSNSTSVGQANRRLLDLRLVKRGARILAAQVDSAAPIYNAMQSALRDGPLTKESWNDHFESVQPKDTAATAMKIGNPVSRKKVVRELVASGGSVRSVSEAELLTAMDAANRDGLSVCPQTGAALAGLKKAWEDGFIRPGERVVVVSTADQMKFPKTLAAFRSMNVVDAKDCEPETIAKQMGL